MDNKRFGVAIIGAGDIACMHIDAYLRLAEECEIVAISDLNGAKAEKLLATSGVRADVYMDYAAMLERDDVDVVSVCTPPFLREGPVVAALAAGKHVVCEKPFAASLEECDAMLDAARRYDRKLAVMLQTRFDREVTALRRIIRSGTLGPLAFATAENHHWRGDAYYRKQWRGSWETERGGVLMNLGVHTLDVFLWIVGQLASVKAETGTLGHAIATEDVAAATLRFRDGTIGQFHCTTVHAANRNAMAFVGKTKTAALHPLSFMAMKEDEFGFPIPDPEAEAALAKLAGREGETEPFPEGFAGPIADLFAAIREGREPVTGGGEVRATVEAVTAIYKAAATGREVRLPLSAEDPWYTTEGVRNGMTSR
ncbi:Gfo/Idh/MocA family protein [Cohnella suwonensis]|uniref:Gfo/Idh/MocA family protein n=1 Tax=Cohnella suwonensis TaxID=696072 RepID=A0ABW0LZ69_9BACL